MEVVVGSEIAEKLIGAIYYNFSCPGVVGTCEGLEGS